MMPYVSRAVRIVPSEISGAQGGCLAGRGEAGRRGGWAPWRRCWPSARLVLATDFHIVWVEHTSVQSPHHLPHVLSRRASPPLRVTAFGGWGVWLLSRHGGLSKYMLLSVLYNISVRVPDGRGVALSSKSKKMFVEKMEEERRRWERVF